jgi:protein gp37
VSANSKIEWTDHTFNPWEGCTKVSPGCANCYAETLVDKRYGRAKWGKGNPRRRTSATNWKQPLKWNREATPVGEAVSFPRPRVFCASLADWLDDEVPIEWLADLLQLICDTPNLDWLLLTKRPENWEPRLFEIYDDDHAQYGARPWIGDWLDGNAPSNVWIGTSVEDQTRANERVPELLKIPARIHFLSCEPLLGRIHLSTAAFFSDKSFRRGIHWVIIGGESGPNARPCHIEWIADLIQQCRLAGVAPFVKQLGSNVARWPAKLQDRKGGNWNEWPQDLRIREFPDSAIRNPQSAISS